MATPPHPGLAGLTVRARIALTVAGLTAAALAVVGVALMLVEQVRIERTSRASVLQETTEFRTFAASVAGTGVSADDAVRTFQSRNSPDAREMLWSFPSSGSPQYVGRPDQGLQRSASLPRAVQALRSSGGVGTIEAGGHEYLVAVQPVTTADSSAAFVVTHDLTKARAELRELLITYTLLAGLSVLGITAAAAGIAGRLLRPLQRLGSTARTISGGDLSSRLTVTGHDDIAELQRTFNAMLDRVETAFEAQRALLDDAGHELRTPLTILRGHLEVLDQHDPADVAATRTLLLDEIDRMGRLVDDLLLLAKSRRPDFVRPAPVDVDRLTRTTLERARGLDERTWLLDESAQVTAALDGQRIVQALLQLADNAVRHTRPGETVAVGSRIVGRELDLWVRDEGPGVDPAVRPVLFDRFTRGDSNDDRGFGLGLSIVRAIAVAHDGRVDLDPSTDTRGARFHVIVPLIRVEPAQEGP